MATYELQRKCGCLQKVKLFGKGHTQAALDRLQDTPCDKHPDKPKARKVSKAPELAMPYNGNTAPNNGDLYAASAADLYTVMTTGTLGGHRG